MTTSPLGVRILAPFAAFLAVLAALFASVLPAQAASTATVSVLHAIPGATVDVYANGKLLLSKFKPGTLTDPQMLPASTYDLKVVQTGAGANGKAVVEAKGVKVPAGANVTVAAHLSAAGKPTLTPYVNDVSTIPAGKARLIVRHTAAAPAVDVRAGGKPVFTGLTNPRQAAAEVAAGTVQADVVLAGKSKPVIGPASLTLREGTTTVVYAWGSAEAGNLKLAVQTIRGMNGSPSGVPGGTGGQAAATGSPWAIGLGAVALLGITVSALQLRRRRTVVAR
jgi:hypothetical protein